MMRPVDQTILAGDSGPHKGDCFRACVASILELPIEAVPHFMEMSGDWFEHFDDWLRKQGLFAMEVRLQEPPACFVSSHDVWCILSAMGPHGVMHSVVGRYECRPTTSAPRFYLEHDPHPSREFFGGNDVEWGLFIGSRRIVIANLSNKAWNLASGEKPQEE